MLNVISIPVLKDNYVWLIVNSHLQQAIAVDPGDAMPVLNHLAQHRLTLAAILVTHKHADHTDGIKTLLEAYPNAAVYAHPTENIPLTTHPIQHNDAIMVNEWSITFDVLHIPGHTQGHVAFYGKPFLFTGDTLFGAGCGRIFEGTADDMLCSLNKLAALPDETLIYCGHEYTLANLTFALHVEPDNKEIQQRIKHTENLRSNNNPSLPSTIELEKRTNPFLRCSEPSIIEKVEAYAQRKLMNTTEVLQLLREWKNRF